MKKWYERDGEIILILVLFFPIGLYLVWNKSVILLTDEEDEDSIEDYQF